MQLPLTRGERFKSARMKLPKKERTLAAVYAATGVPSSKIKDLENDAVQRSVGYPDIIKLARHYHVSMDWLFGESDFRDVETDQVLAKDLGLSEESVQALRTIKETNESSSFLLPILNRILMHDSFPKILSGIEDYTNAVKLRLKYQSQRTGGKPDQNMSWTAGSRLIQEATGGQYDIVSREDKAYIMEFKLQKNFQTIVEDVKNDFLENENDSKDS